MAKDTFITRLVISIIVVCLIGFLILSFFFLAKGDKEKLEAILKDDNKTEQQAKDEEVALKQANQPAIKQANQPAFQSVKAVDQADHVWGDITAPVQLIVYNDFDDSFCFEFYNTIKQIRQEFASQTVVAFRHFPQTIHPYAAPAALAAECAAEQDKFWQMSDKLFIDNKAGKMNLGQFRKDAIEIGLDAAKFNQCLETEKYKDRKSVV